MLSDGVFRRDRYFRVERNGMVGGICTTATSDGASRGVEEFEQDDSASEDEGQEEE
jgi:hypothetical protein